MNPAEFIQLFANKGMVGTAERDPDPLNFVIDSYDDLNMYASELNIISRTYVVRSRKSLVLPKQGEPEDCLDLTFSGEFVSYDEVIPPRYLGRAAVKGLCLTFGNITVLPFEETLPDVKLHVPRLEVQSIDRVIT